MNEKINVLVVGAGAQGAPCVAILARQPSVDRILPGTRELAAFPCTWLNGSLHRAKHADR